METGRPVVLSIAGFDPCGGAGLLADIKTFEQHKVYGLGISTAQTLQTENDFYAIRWEQESDIMRCLETMLSCYNIKAVKIGIVEDTCSLKKIVSLIHQKDETIKIVADTVLRSSTGFDFQTDRINKEVFQEVLSKIYLITPNYTETVALMPAPDAKEAAQILASHCHVLLKGGHNKEELGVDYLYMNSGIEKLDGNTDGVYAKHGSGCVLSAAITANLALGFDLVGACRNAKRYIEQFLSSNKSLLGYHHVK